MTPCDPCAAVQSQKAVSAYFSSKQIPPFVFARQCGGRIVLARDPRRIIHWISPLLYHLTFSAPCSENTLLTFYYLSDGVSHLRLKAAQSDHMVDFGQKFFVLKSSHKVLIYKHRLNCKGLFLVTILHLI